MKKTVLSLVVVVMMIGMLAGCGSKSVVGEWHLDTMGGKTVEEYATENSVDAAQLQTNYTFKEDGTGSMENSVITASGADGSFTWTEKDGVITITANGQNTEFKWNGDKLESTVSGVTSTLATGKVEIGNLDDAINDALATDQAQ